MNKYDLTKAYELVYIVVDLINNSQLMKDPELKQNLIKNSQLKTV